VYTSGAGCARRLSLSRARESRCPPFQGLEDALCQEHVQGLAGDDFHDAPSTSVECPYSQVVRFEGERQLGERLDEIRQHPLLRKNSGVAIHFLDRCVLSEDSVSQTRGMAQQVLYRDLALAFTSDRVDAPVDVSLTSPATFMSLNSV